MSVDEVVARALADNPELRAARAEVDAAGGRLRQAGLRPNPMLELGGQKAISPDSNLSIGVTLPLDLNGRVDGRVGVATREVEMKRALVAERERRLVADVRLKAGELLAARRNVEVTDELLLINREGLRLVGDRVREGAAPALDESLLLVEVNRLEAGRQMLESRVTVLALQLKALAGMEPDAPLTLRGELAGAAPGGQSRGGRGAGAGGTPRSRGRQGRRGHGARQDSQGGGRGALGRQRERRLPAPGLRISAACAAWRRTGPCSRSRTSSTTSGRA